MNEIISIGDFETHSDEFGYFCLEDLGFKKSVKEWLKEEQTQSLISLLEEKRPSLNFDADLSPIKINKNTYVVSELATSYIIWADAKLASAFFGKIANMITLGEVLDIVRSDV